MLKYKTAKKYYPVLVKWFNFWAGIDDYMWKHRKNKWIWYIDDFIRCFKHGGFKDCSLYFWEIEPRYEKLLKFIFKILGCLNGLMVIKQIANDWDTKLLDCNPRYCYTRNRGWITRYYTCSLFPFNYIKLTRTTYDTEKQQCINTYGTFICSLLGDEKPGEIKTNVITLYKGFVYNKKQVIKLYRAYKKDLNEIDKIMEQERQKEKEKMQNEA